MSSFAGDHHERHLLQLGVADLLLHPVVGVVDLDPQPLGPHPLRDVVQVVVVPLGDRDGLDLHRGEPGRERAGVVLDEHAEEPLDRAELRRVDHHRLLAGAVGAPGTRARSRAGWLKSYWMVDICQVRPIASRHCTEIFGP